MGGKEYNSFLRKWRFRLVIILACIFSVVVIVWYGRLAYKPSRTYYKETHINERGSIVDRNGAPLAVQTSFYDIGCDPKNLLKQKNAAEFAEKVSKPLSMTQGEVMEIIERHSNETFAYLRKKVDQTVYTDLKSVVEANRYTPYVIYDKVQGRIYPNHSLASHLIGYLGVEGKGMSGIEYSQQELLASSKDGDISVPGKNVYLTIDSNLQYKLEHIAFDSMKETQAESMMMLAVNSRTGEILSYISLPQTDLNDYGSSTPAQQFDHLRMEAYEPGSVFKIFTVSILYDMGRISQTDSFLCDGMYEHRIPGGETVRIKCLEHHGWLTAREAISLSCNDAIGQISDRVDEDLFISKIRQLGFGNKTGIELSGETPAIVKDTSSKSWSGRSKPTISIGQEITVSALQMVEAATAVANGGVPVKLTLIKRITNKDGSVVYEHQPEYKDRVFKKETSDYVLSCMETTSKMGNGTRANIRDISIGTKTGTAQMADPVKGGYSDTDFLSSCIAVFPTDDPEIILYVVIEKAKGEVYGGRIAAPVINTAANAIIDHLGMSRGSAASLEHSGTVTIPRGSVVNIGEFLPDFTGLNKRELAPILERKDLKVNIYGSGWVQSQTPEPGTPVTENMVIELNLE